MKHELFVAHRVGADTPDTRAGLSLEAADFAHALFTRSGALTGWNGAFAANVSASDLRRDIHISAVLPRVDDALWAQTWLKLDAGQTVTLRRGSGSAGPNYDVCVTPVFGAQGRLASVEIKHPSVSNSQLLQQLQKEILEVVATGWPLPDVVDLLCRRAEAMSPGVMCSVLRADLGANCLYPLAGPSLPQEVQDATQCVPIGPGIGSCGNTAFYGEATEATDISTDQRWEPFKNLFLPHGLRACWSTPIKGRSEQVLGTFAFYYREPRGPDMLERQIVEACVHLCAIAIDHDNAHSSILKLAYRDSQTDLPNRTAFQQHTCAVLQQIPGTGHALALHYIDLDDFKGVNDTLGHVVGDQLLRAVGRRFLAACQDGEYVARLGGDEFAVLQFPFKTSEDIDRLAEKLLHCFDDPFEIEGRKITISASIGIARAPIDSDNFTDLLRRADVALYRAKGAGRATYCPFNEEMGQQLLIRREIESDLREAIENDELVPYFQPIVDLATGRIIAFEALARWILPSGSFVPPNLFIPLAEEMGIIGELGEQILRRACIEAATWPKDIKVAVNLSSLQLGRHGFVQEIERVLAESGLAPERLELEITETVPLIENAAMREILHGLRRRGICIALDDFGTGYSSLSYLRSFPFDRLKIDQSFVGEIHEHEETMAVIKAMLDLARSLDVRTTAEGIETEQQRIWLQSRGCSEGQGYLFERPMPAAKVADFLRAQPDSSTHAFRRRNA
jgi:diguanylate cyclase (GGDEF)-like protein